MVGFIVGVAVGVSVVSAIFLLLLWWHDARNNYNGRQENERNNQNYHSYSKRDKRDSRHRKKRRRHSPFRVPPSVISGSAPADSPQPTYYLGAPDDDDVDDYDPSWSDVENRIDSVANSHTDSAGYSIGPYTSNKRFSQRKTKLDHYQQTDTSEQEEGRKVSPQHPIHLPDLSNTNHQRHDSNCSFSTVDYDYAKAHSANSSIISSVGGTDGENFSKDDEEASSLGSSSLIWSNIQTQRKRTVTVTDSNADHASHHPQHVLSLQNETQQEQLVFRSSSLTSKGEHYIAYDHDPPTIDSKEKKDAHSICGSLSLSTSSHSAFSSGGSSLMHQQMQRVQHPALHQPLSVSVAASTTTLTLYLPLPTPPLGMVLKRQRHRAQDQKPSERGALVHALKETSPLLQNEKLQQIRVGDVLIGVGHEAIPEHWSALEISKWIRQASKKATQTNIPLSLTFERKGAITSSIQGKEEESRSRGKEVGVTSRSDDSSFEAGSTARQTTVPTNCLFPEDQLNDTETPIHFTDCDDDCGITHNVERVHEEEEILFIKEVDDDSTLLFVADENALFHQHDAENGETTIHSA